MADLSGSGRSLRWSWITAIISLIVYARTVPLLCLRPFHGAGLDSADGATGISEDVVEEEKALDELPQSSSGI